MRRASRFSFDNLVLNHSRSYLQEAEQPKEDDAGQADEPEAEAPRPKAKAAAKAKGGRAKGKAKSKAKSKARAKKRAKALSTTSSELSTDTMSKSSSSEHFVVPEDSTSNAKPAAAEPAAPTTTEKPTKPKRTYKRKQRTSPESYAEKATFAKRYRPNRAASAEKWDQLKDMYNSILRPFMSNHVQMEECTVLRVGFRKSACNCTPWPRCISCNLGVGR